MAVVIIGGLVTSTVLNLFLLPSIYLRYGRARVEE
jgi:Cu/Ag efflux pump CusA